MLYSEYNVDDTIYLSWHMEMAFASTTNDKESSFNSEMKKKGMYTSELRLTTLYRILEKIKKYKDKRIILDFDMINNLNESENVEFHLIDLIESCFRNGNNVYFINVSRGFSAKIHPSGAVDGRVSIYDHFNKSGQAYEKYYPATEQKSDYFNFCFSYDKSYFSTPDFLNVGITSNINKYLRQGIFEQKLKDHYIKPPINESSRSGYMVYQSSQVYLSKYIDIKQLISERDLFFKVIYCIALEMIDKGIMSRTLGENKKKVFFFHTLNGASIATILAELFCIDSLYLDHLGPVNRIFKNNFENRISSSKNYLVVCDVNGLGSEVNRAKTIIEFSGGNYSGNISLVNIKTIELKGYEEKQKAYSFYEIDGQKARDFKYEIKTELDF